MNADEEDRFQVEPGSSRTERMEGLEIREDVPDGRESLLETERRSREMQREHATPHVAKLREKGDRRCGVGEWSRNCKTHPFLEAVG